MGFSVTIPISLKSKPRGQLNKAGKMTHSTGGYRDWQDEFSALIRSTSFRIPPDFHGLVFQFNIKPRGGHPPDLSNLQGAIEDSLVKDKYIRDDNWTVLQRYYTFARVSDKPSVTIYVVMSQIEMIHVIEKFDTKSLTLVK